HGELSRTTLRGDPPALRRAQAETPLQRCGSITARRGQKSREHPAWTQPPPNSSEAARRVSRSRLRALCVVEPLREAHGYDHRSGECQARAELSADRHEVSGKAKLEPAFGQMMRDARAQSRSEKARRHQR